MHADTLVPLTARLPIRTGNCSVPLPGQGHYGLAPWEYTLGELFCDAGYATAAFGKCVGVSENMHSPPFRQMNLICVERLKATFFPAYAMTPSNALTAYVDRLEHGVLLAMLGNGASPPAT